MTFSKAYARLNVLGHILSGSYANASFLKIFSGPETGILLLPTISVSFNRDKRLNFKIFSVAIKDNLSQKSLKLISEYTSIDECSTINASILSYIINEANENNKSLNNKNKEVLHKAHVSGGGCAADEFAGA